MTQITIASGYSTRNMIFSKPIEERKGAIKNYRMPIKTKYPDGTEGDLILPTEECFSFGLSENKDFNNPDAISGFVLPIDLWGREGASDAQKEWYDTFVAITDRCKKHVYSVRNELGKHDLEPNDSELKKLNPAYIKKDKETGKVVENVGPRLYVKLISKNLNNQKNGQKKVEEEPVDDKNKYKNLKIFTKFFDSEDNLIDPFQLMGQRCNVRAAIKIESIFVGSKISLQLKLVEACVELLESSSNRLLSRKNVIDSKVKQSLVNPLVDDNDEETGSLGGDDEPKQVEDEPPKKKNDDVPIVKKKKEEKVIVEEQEEEVPKKKKERKLKVVTD